MTTAQPTGRIMLRNVRLAFPNLFEPSTVGGEGEPAYSAVLLMPADHPQLAQINKVIEAVATEKWNKQAPALLKAARGTDKVCLKDGDLKAQYDGFPGNFFLNTRAQVSARPTVIDADKSPLTARDGRPYAGCYVNASIDIWVQDNKYGKRINAQIRGVQFLRDGDAFAAGRPADADEFEAITEGADAPDMGDFA